MLKKLSIRQKIVISFMTCAILLLIVGFFGYNGIKLSQDRYNKLINNTIPEINYLNSLNEKQAQLALTLNMLVTQNISNQSNVKGLVEKSKNISSSIDSLFSKMKNIVTDDNSNIEKYLNSANSLKEKQLAFINNIEATSIDSVIKTAEDARFIQLSTQMNQINEEYTANNLLLLNLINNNATEITAINSNDTNEFEHILLVLIIAIIMSEIVGYTMARILSVSIRKSIKGILIETNLLTDAVIKGKLDARANIENIHFEFRNIIKGFNDCLDAAINPLNVAVNYIDRISKGDIPEKITDKYNGDINDIINNLNQCIDSLNGLTNEMSNNTNLQIAGDIEAFADETKFEGSYKTIIKGYNQALKIHIDTTMDILNLLNEYANGDLSKEMKILPGKQIIATERVNLVRQNVLNLITDAGMLAKAAVEGKLATRADITKHQGDFRKIIEGLNNTLDAVVGPLNVAANYVDRISKGDIPAKITDRYNGDFNEIINNLNQCIEAVNLLVSDANMLSSAAVEGRLAARANASRHLGDFKKIIVGVNNTLDAVITPLNVAANYVDRISKGDIPSKITDSYNGDFNEVINNLNKCIDAQHNMSNDVRTLCVASFEGRFNERVDSTKHEGIYSKIVHGMNDMMENITSPLIVAADYVDKISKGNIPPKINENYNGDFNIIKNNLNICIDAINLLIADAKSLENAAFEGKLGKRADVNKHQGDFKAIIKGVNNTLDNVIGPLFIAANYIDNISKGDMPPIITDDFKGDFSGP